MGVLIFLVLLGLVVLLSPFILAGAAYLIVYPALLGLVLLIFPPTRGWGVVILVGCFFYYGIKESVNDSKGRKQFIAMAKNAGFDRRSINKMVRSKKPNETWQDCINQLNGVSSAAAATNPAIPTVLHELTADEAKDFIKDDAQRAIALKFAISKGSYITKYGLTSFARTDYKVEIPDMRAESLLSSLAFSPRVIASVRTDEFDNNEYKLNCSVSDSVTANVDEQIAEIIKEVLKKQVEEYRQILVDNKDAIEKYSKTFTNLASKVIKKVDKWGDYDQSKIDELKIEFIYKIFRVVNKDSYNSEKSKEQWADMWFDNNTKNIGEARLVNGTPYWMKHFYDIDLPKLLKPYLHQTKKQIAA